MRISRSLKRIGREAGRQGAALPRLLRQSRECARSALFFCWIPAFAGMARCGAREWRGENLFPSIT
ncbi:MAG: hypothetical protein OXU61_01280 [Gammaproteobacteria bacterium]|nr:hypothetical protein [Gammaproteobacteria bacterium]